MIGPFALGDVLVRGAHGTIVAAHHRDDPTRSLVAKIAHRGHESRLHREAALLRRVRHRNIIQPIALVDDTRQAALVMPRALSSLSAHLSRLVVAEVAAVVAAIAAGMDALHRSGVAHRDLRASNVLLFDGGRPVIVDLGAAVALTGASRDADVAAAARLGLELLAPGEHGTFTQRLAQIAAQPVDARGLAALALAVVPAPRLPDPSNAAPVPAEPPTVEADV